MLRILLRLFLLISVPCTLWGQAALLSAEEALARSLESNFSVRLQRISAQQAANDVTKGNAGFLPRVDLVGAVGYGNQNTNQQFASGLDQERLFAQSFNGSLGVALNWTLYDGRRMFYAYDRLGQEAELGQLELRLAVEAAAENTLLAYYDLVRRTQQLRALDFAIGLAQARKSLAETLLQNGRGSKTEILQAELDQTALEAARLRECQGLSEGRVQLNLLMARDPMEVFSVADTLPLAAEDSLRILYERALSDQTLLVVRAQQVKLARTAQAEVAAQQKPRLDFGASYQYARTHNQAGFLLFNQNYGLNTGFTLTWNLYDGKNTRRQIENARLAVLAAETNAERARSEAAGQAANALQACLSAREVLALEDKALQLADQQFGLVRERYLAGSATAYELREAQRSLEDARSRAIGVRFEALRAELALRRMAGSF